jgi:hypothetical protein
VCSVGRGGTHTGVVTEVADGVEVVSPSVGTAARVGAPLIVFGVLLGAFTIRGHDWAVPVTVSAAITLTGTARALIWAWRARQLRIRLGAGSVKITRGSSVVVNADADDIDVAEFVRPGGSILFSPNATVATLALHVSGQAIDVPLYMPFEPQIHRLETMWRGHGLPG